MLECIISLSADGRASTFDLLLDNRTGQYTSIPPNAEVTITGGKTGYSVSTIFVGIVEGRVVERATKNVNYLRLRGTDYSFKLLNTIVPGSRTDTGVYQLEAGDVNRRSGWFISDIVFDLVTKHAADITVTSGVSGSVVSSSTYISPIVFNYKPLSDCIKELADLAPLYNFYVDGAKTLQFFYEQNKDSGITIDDTLIKSIEIETDIQNTKNVIYALGGDQSVTDVSYTGAGFTISTHSAWHGIQFTPSQPSLSEVWLNVGRTGNPPIDLQGEIVIDNNNAPTGAKIAVFSIPASKIATSPDWRIATINYEPLQVGTKHWVVLYYSGGNSTNTYNWAHDGGTSGVNAVGADGINWTVTSSSYRPNILTKYRKPIIHKAVDEKSVINIGALETSISQPDIYNYEQLIAYASRALAQYGKARVQVKASIYPPDRLPTPGQLITVSDSVSGASGLYVVTEMEYTIRGYEAHNIDMKAFRFE